MNTMTYKDFSARIEYSENDECFIGHIMGIRDVVGFHGDSVQTLQASFIEAVDDYLATCLRLGLTPNRPYSGQLRVRLAPETHARAAQMAESVGKSLNAWVSEAIETRIINA